MGKRGSVPSQCFIEHQLAQGIGQVLFRPDHVGHLHQVIIHHHAEVVYRHAVRPENDEIAQRARFPGDRSPDRVMDGVRLVRHPETEGVGNAGIQLFLNFSVTEISAGAVIMGGPLFRFRLFPLGFQFRIGTEAAVGMTGIQQPVCVFPVQVPAFRLTVRSGVSPDFRAFIPIHTQPFQVILDDLF